MYISLKSNTENKAVTVTSTKQFGSAQATLDPSTTYRVEFFASPNLQGTVLLRKYFTTMSAPTQSISANTPSPDVIKTTTPNTPSDPATQNPNTSSSQNNQTATIFNSNWASSFGNSTILASLINFNTKGDQVVRFDMDGNAIDAHDGEIRYYEGKYYLYGTSYNCGFLWLRTNTKFCGFKIYSSTDLMHWKDEGLVFDGSTALWQARCINGCFNLHSLYNPTTKLYVVWVNVQDSTTPYGYRVFTGSSPTGPFTETASPPQLAYQHAGAGNIFLDDDGTAYYLYTLSGDVNGGSLVIEKLNSTFTSGTGQKTFIWDSTKQSPDGFKAHEGPAMFKRNGMYYVVHGPACPYCNHTYAEYSSSSSPLGTWTFGTNGTNGMLNETSCGGQPSHVAILPSGTATTYLFMSDLWNQTGFYDWKTDPRFHSNQALANYFWTPLSFDNTGAIKPFSCDPVSPVTISGSMGQNNVRPVDQASADTNFTTWCDIGGAQRLQTFIPSRTGKLSSVSFNTFLGGNPGNSFPDQDLIVDIVEVNANKQPVNTLGTFPIDRKTLGYSSRRVTVTPNITVQAGKEYGIRLKANLTQGCYGLAYSDLNPYPKGSELHSANGITFNLEPNRALKFEITVDSQTPPPPPPPNKITILINAGGQNYTDTDKNVWQASACPTGSAAFTTTAPISGTLEQKLYQDECYSTGNTPYTYTISDLVKGNNYSVTLKFAEISYETTGQRVFNVDINGTRVLNNFDVYATAGAHYKAVDKNFSATADTLGKITITFSPIPGKSSATISAIKIVSQ
jgi:hypothetical protein